MVAESQIRQMVTRLVSRELSLEAFEDWFVHRTWNMHRDSAEGAQKLASQIELLLAEYSSGHLGEPELLEQLTPLAAPFISVVQPFAAGSVNVIVRAVPIALGPLTPQSEESQYVGTSPAAGYE